MNKITWCKAEKKKKKETQDVLKFRSGEEVSVLGWVGAIN